MKQKTISSTTRTSILDAASKVILDQGVDALTLEAVAKEAGLSKGGLLYHFQTKRLLIEGMLNRLIAEVDSWLEEELVKNDGDYLAAYIYASFKTNPERDKISNALFAAIANEPDLIKPLQARFFRMQGEIVAAAESPEIGTIIRLALDGLWISDLFGFAPPSLEMRKKMLDALLIFAKKAA
jgi:AcrR family transcriptional regulator